MAFGNLGTIWSEIGLNTAKLQAGVTTAKMQLSTLDRQAMTQAASINAKLNTIGSGLQSVGKKMSMYVTLPILAVGAASVKAGMDFESGMTKSLAIMGDISPQIRAEMEKTAKSIVDYTTFSAKEGADAYFYLASAGLNAAQSMEALPRVAKFAQAGQFDLALATDLLTDAQSALGMTIRDDVVANMENMVRVSDVLVKANTLSNATVQQFSESLTNKAGAALKLLNKDVEEGVAVLAAWADQGVKGAEAGNWLNIVLRDLQRSAIENESVFEDFNIQVFDTNGNVRNMADVIGDLETALDGMSDKEKRATLMMLGFQDRSISAMMTLLGTSDAIRTYEDSLRDAAGFTEDVAAKQMESFSAQLEQLKNRAINVGISLFDILKPRLEGLLDVVKRGIDWFDDLSTSQKNMVIILGSITAAIGPVLYGLGAMIRTVATLRTGFIALNIATKGWLSTISVYTAAAAASYAIGEGVERLSNKVDNLYGPLIRIIYPFSEFIHLSKLYIEVYRGLKDGTLEWIDLLKMNRVQLENWSDAHREGANIGLGMAEATVELSDSMKEYTDKSVKAKVATQDNGSMLKNLQEQYGFTREEALEYAEAEGLLADETDDTTNSIDEQRKAIDELRRAYSDLISEIFGITNAENDLQESEWALEDAQKAVTEALNKHGEGSREAEQAINDYDDALQDNLITLFDLYTQEDLDIERKEELRQKLVELLRQTQETSELSQEEFINMATQFGLSGQEIIDMAGEVGFELDEATKDRLVTVGVDYSRVDPAITVIRGKLDGIPRKITTVVDIQYAPGMPSQPPKLTAMGGIVGYAHGGIIGNDGAKIPPLTAAYGMVVPQTGRKVPILAHEGEIIANTSQQRNLAEWIMDKANSRPDGSGSGITIENFNVITPKGTPSEIAQETRHQLRLMGMEAQIS